MTFNIDLSFVRAFHSAMKASFLLCFSLLICYTRAEQKDFPTQEDSANNNHPIKSCLDVLRNGITKSGFYPIIDDQGRAQTLFCDLCSEHGSAWTLVMSFSMKNRVLEEFLITPLSTDASLNQAIPNWNSYRLSRKDMMNISHESTHWRFTCSYHDYKVDYTDYARARLDVMNPLTYNESGACAQMEYLDVRGNTCVECSAAWWQNPAKLEALHLDSSGDTCDFDGRKGSVKSEDNFGYYVTVNTKFRCTANETSTTNFWLGGYL